MVSMLLVCSLEPSYASDDSGPRHSRSHKYKARKGARKARGDTPRSYHHSSESTGEDTVAVPIKELRVYHPKPQMMRVVPRPCKSFRVIIIDRINLLYPPY